MRVHYGPKVREPHQTDPLLPSGELIRQSSEFFGMETPHFNVWEDIPPPFLIEKYGEYVKIVLSFVGEFHP